MKMKIARGRAGMNAEPSCRRHAIAPTSLTMTFAQKPRNIPKARKSKMRSDFCSVYALGCVPPLTSPQLPTHDERTTNGRGRVLSSKDGDGGALSSHADTENQTDNEELLPVVRETRGDGCDDEDDGGDENCSAATKVVVQRVTEPASAESRGNVRCRIDDTYDPLVTVVVWRVVHCGRVRHGRDAKLDGERQVSSVGACLVPSLRCSANRAAEDGGVH